MKHFSIIYLFCMLFVSVECLAAAIKLSSFESYEKQDQHFLDASFSVELNEEILDALKHGIPLQINADFEVRMTRDWYPDKTVQSVHYMYQLSHQPLTEDYLTVNLKTGLRASFDSLTAALTQIGEFSGVKLVQKQILSSKHRYKGRTRMYLDLDSLPTPMRPQVYFSDSWNIGSDWHEWVIQE